jgi:hypothetical protein
MQKFIANLFLGLFKLQPATTQTKTFASGVAAIAACIVAIATMIVNGDTTAIDYVAAIAGALVACGQIFHRDALTKIGDMIENFTASKPK